jgi:GTP-binding protein EngB required for normal cell division
MSKKTAKSQPTKLARDTCDESPQLSRETVRDLLEGLAKADEAAVQRGTNKDLVLVVGNTGSGKSTFVNYLMGKAMKEERVKNSMEKGFTCDNPIMEIGHGFKSQTSFPESCCDPATNLTYCDCPGFMDNRGVVFDITNMYALTRMAQKARSVKGVVIIINYHALMSDRARGLRETLSLLETIFCARPDSYSRSSILLVTRAPSDGTLAELREFLGDAVASGEFSHSAHAAQLFAHLASTCEFYDPLDRYSDRTHQRIDRLGLIRTIQGFTSIPPTSLNVGLSVEAINTLGTLLTTLSHSARENFEHQRIDPQVHQFLEVIEGLRVLRCVTVDQHYHDFLQHMFSRLRAWSSDLEMLSVIQDIGVQLPLVSEEVDTLVTDMVNRLEEKKAMGEKLEGMESSLELAQKELHIKHMANEALEAEKKAAEASARTSESELAKIRDDLKGMQNQIEVANKEATQLREQLNRPQPYSGMDNGLVDLFRLMAMQSGGGMGGGMGGMMMGGDPMGGMMGGFDDMSIGRSRGSTGGCSPAICPRGSTGGGTVYRGRGRPRNSDYTASGKLRRK